jgi:hypothetical protein
MFTITNTPCESPQPSHNGAGAQINDSVIVEGLLTSNAPVNMPNSRNLFWKQFTQPLGHMYLKGSFLTLVEKTSLGQAFQMRVSASTPRCIWVCGFQMGNT